MKITDALLGEHGVYYNLFSQIEKIISTSNSLEEVKGSLKMLADPLISHAMIEENILFPAIAPKLGPGGPVEIMQAEHKEIEMQFEVLLHSKSLDEIKNILPPLIDLVKEHFMKEEEILFLMTVDHLSEKEITDLGKRWAKTREVRI